MAGPTMLAPNAEGIVGRWAAVRVLSASLPSANLGGAGRCGPRSARLSSQARANASRLQCTAMASSVEEKEASAAPSDRTTTVGGDGGSLEIVRVVNGMWQTSSRAWGKASPPAILDAMVAHFDAGLTTFDMADIYGPAEDYYGDMLDYLRRSRGEEVAAQAQGLTKFVPSPGRMTRAIVQSAVDRSRQKMQVNTLDMVQFHWWDYSNPGYLDALKHLTDLKEEGKIRTVALTNFDTEHLQIALENGIPIVSNQVQHSLVDMRPQQQMAELCALTGVKLITYGTVLGGLLSEKYLDLREPNSVMGPSIATPSQGKYKRLLRECKTVADKHGVSISNVAVRYILDRPGVGASMVGVRFGISEHIQDTQRLFNLRLDEDDNARLEAVLSQGRDLLELIGDCGDEYR